MKPDYLWLILPIVLQSLAAATPEESSLEAISKRYTKRTPNGVHLPIVRRETRGLTRRAGSGAAIGLGDSLDISYTALVTVGGIATPVIIDTGSSDLWVMSDACADGCTGAAKLFPQATFKSADIGISLNYGDSSTATFALGLAGTDTVDVAGITLQDQTFAAINQTNTTLAAIGATGIFGLGFPVNSIVWSEIFQASSQTKTTSRESTPRSLTRRLVMFGSAFSGLNFRRISFPTISAFFDSPPKDTPSPSGHETRQTPSTSTPSAFDSALASFRTIGPFIPRLITSGSLAQPLISVTLQRNTVDVGGNVGMLSIGELPTDVDVKSMTWVPLRKYSRDEGGLPAPSDSPNEEYPVTWEINIDDVYLDGVKLPRSTIAPASLGYSALVDTGNSLIRGPEDLVDYINKKLGNDGLFQCSQPHTLAFEIGGKLFSVDPRDFVSQQFKDNVDACVSNLAPTDPPKVGNYLFSWSLGTPFLKSVVASFYYGNITYPSKDEPRMGFLSTVPDNAGDLLKAAVVTAKNGAKNFPAISQLAPSGTATPGAVGSGANPKTTSPSKSSSAVQTYTLTSPFIAILFGLLTSAWTLGL
ncbi:aspartic peptidase domain-containing protein [Crepidotus variabilis]|uniref:Aspartic peptidase domain-containing protein n=1 Tax=Crepidotus variabilis TaxID=179855 RepID=A0A9P6EMU0_9AGAR|nr:aspartic peptidase domain-containing protein [Crepidotus variabilis]